MMSFAERLKKAREDAGLSQSALARLVGIAPQSIQLMENGSTKRSRHTVHIAALLGVRPEWLETGDGPRERADEFNIPLPSDPAIDASRTPYGLPTRAAGVSRASSHARSSPDIIPLFISRSLLFMRHEDEEAERWSRDAESHFIIRRSKDPDHDLFSLLWRHIQELISPEPDEFIPRPRNLAGVVEAYAIYPVASPNIAESATLHVNPHKSVRPGEHAVFWITPKLFVLGTFGMMPKDGTTYVTVFHSFGGMPFDVSNKSGDYYAIHPIVGLEFHSPRLDIRKLFVSGAGALPPIESDSS